MNISESTHLYQLVDGLKPGGEPYQAVEALVALVERAHKALGAGDTPEQVVNQISAGVTSGDAAAIVFLPFATACGDIADEIAVERMLKAAAS